MMTSIVMCCLTVIFHLMPVFEVANAVRLVCLLIWYPVKNPFCQIWNEDQNSLCKKERTKNGFTQINSQGLRPRRGYIIC